MAGLELALVQVDCQRQDRVAFIAGVGVGQNGGVEFSQRKCDVVEKSNPYVTIHVRQAFKEILFILYTCVPNSTECLRVLD